MIRTSFLHPRRLTPPNVTTTTRFLTWRALMLACAAGVASAVLGHLLGRSLHEVWPIPTSGSILVALPRAIILLVLLLRVNRFGVLTVAAMAEIGVKLGFGVPGMWPMFLIAPLLGNVAGDLLWFGLRRISAPRIRLMLTGAALCVARVLAALLFWSLFHPTILKTPQNLDSLLVCIVVINVALGAIAGFLVGRRTISSRPVEKK